jgi:hypothetical protein
MSGYRVEKQSYSLGAWRVLDAESGEQVYRREMFDHPFLGVIPISGPVCFDRKRDAVAWVASQSLEVVATS